MRADGIAVLRMPGWALYQSSWNWRGWLAERLDALATDRSARGLVVDVRGNEGGLDCGNPIIQRFAQQPSTLSTRRLVRFRSVPQGLRAVLDTWDPNFFELGGKAAPVDDQFFALPETDTTLRPEGRSLRHLPLRVLVDGANSSAAFVFAQRIQQDRLGLLVGTPTGGNQRGINGGAFFFVRLPHSGIEFDLPLIGTFPAQPVPDGGLNPDIPAAPTRADVSIGRDPALTAALRSMA
jgi:C-terminal processing protease CtpA/Prc